MRHSRYINAASVLATELLDAVCEAVGWKPCFLWVPASRRRGMSKRDRAVLTLTEQGYSASRVASRLFLSERTIRRILAKARAASALSVKESEGQLAPKASLNKGVMK